MNEKYIDIKLNTGALKATVKNSIHAIILFAGIVWLLFGKLFVSFIHGSMAENIITLILQAVVPFVVITSADCLLNNVGMRNRSLHIAFTIIGSMLVGARYCYHNLGCIDQNDNLSELITTIIGATALYTLILAIVCIVVAEMMNKRNTLSDRI